MSATVSLKINWITTSMYSEIWLLYWLTHLCVCTFPNDIGAHVRENAVFSRRLSDLRLWLLRSPFEHSAGRFQPVSCLLWFRCTLLGASLIAQWEPALSLEHCRGNGHKGISSVLYFGQPVTLHVLTTMCSARGLAVPREEREKSLIGVSIFCVSISITKVFLGFVFLVLNNPFKKSQQLK